MDDVDRRQRQSHADGDCARRGRQHGDGDERHGHGRERHDGSGDLGDRGRINHGVRRDDHVDDERGLRLAGRLRHVDVVRQLDAGQREPAHGAFGDADRADGKHHLSFPRALARRRRQSRIVK